MIRLQSSGVLFFVIAMLAQISLAGDPPPPPQGKNQGTKKPVAAQPAPSKPAPDVDASNPYYDPVAAATRIHDNIELVSPKSVVQISLDHITTPAGVTGQYWIKIELCGFTYKDGGGADMLKDFCKEMRWYKRFDVGVLKDSSDVEISNEVDLKSFGTIGMGGYAINDYANQIRNAMGRDKKIYFAISVVLRKKYYPKHNFIVLETPLFHWDFERNQHSRRLFYFNDKDHGNMSIIRDVNNSGVEKIEIDSKFGGGTENFVTDATLVGKIHYADAELEAKRAAEAKLKADQAKAAADAEAKKGQKPAKNGKKGQPNAAAKNTSGKACLPLIKGAAQAGAKPNDCINTLVDPKAKAGTHK